MVRLQTVPSTDGVLGEGGCDPYFVVRCLRRSGNGWTSHKLFDQFKGGGKIRKRHAADRFATLDPLEPVSIRGDVNVAVYDYEGGGKNTKICGAWLDAARERARSPSERPRRAPRRRREDRGLSRSYPGLEVHCLVLDMMDIAKVESMVEDLPAGFKEVDILVNNAGLALGKTPA